MSRVSVIKQPHAAAVTGALTLAPLAALSAVVGERIEPFFSLIRPGPHTGAAEHLLLVAALLLLPVGAFVAGRPLTQRGPGGMRPLHALNGAVVALLASAFVAISFGFGAEIYRCDVLRIPNCD